MLDFDSDKVSAWKICVCYRVQVFGALSRIELQSQADHGLVFGVPVAHPQPMIYRSTIVTGVCASKHICQWVFCPLRT